MKKRPGNPNWGKPVVGSVVITLSEFERVVRELKLKPNQYLRSEALRQWAELNADSKYVPESLLAAWKL
jgi:hypothetical protein